MEVNKMAKQFYFKMEVSEPGRLKQFHIWSPTKQRCIATFIVGEGRYAEFLTENEEVAAELKSLGYKESEYNPTKESGVMAAEPLKPLEANAVKENQNVPTLETIISPAEAMDSITNALAADESDSIFNE
jgi:hypothetical protein